MHHNGRQRNQPAIKAFLRHPQSLTEQFRRITIDTTSNNMTGTSLGPYDILSKLGEGGMGAVYRALDRRLGREVALKILPADLAGNQDRRARFIREAQAASRLNHPNIITIYDIAEADLPSGRIHYIAMECISGNTLEGLTPAEGLEPVRAQAIAADIASALSRAHAAGVVHRDLKPANVMVTDDGIVKVLDFGLAKLVPTGVSDTAATITSAGTQLGMILGTAAYMSPEQASGLPVDARSDIFSFGLVLYEMISGRRAFPGQSPLAAVAGILHSEARPLTDVPEHLAAVVKRCLRKAPEARFQTMAEVQAALSSGISGSRSSLSMLTPAPAVLPSIAVLPFVNLNRDPESDFFCDGLTEELINGLSQLRTLRVVSRSTVFQFKGGTEDIRQVAAKLHVSTALEGSVRRAGNRLRITSQLINAADGCQLWSQRFDREMQDVFDVQDEVPQAILEHLKVHFPSGILPAAVKNQGQNPEAWTLYLKGRYYQHWTTTEGYRKALEHYQEAIALDPGMAKPWAGIADIYIFSAIVGLGRPNDLMPQAHAAALRALELDETLAEANSALGLVHLWFDWDWAASEAAFGLADALFLGRAPLGQVIELCRKTIDLAPPAIWPHWYLINALASNRDFAEIPGAIAQARQLAAGEPVSEGIFGWALALAGDHEEARRMAAELTERRASVHSPAVPIAWIHLGLGDHEAALDWLETARLERDPLLAMSHVNPTHDVLRDNPRFQALLHQMQFA
ncbi:MAG: hypothetical protein EBY17_06950 [Acidobacteriia bacterium]|nr:hypothetical protein [Terriglobia bacterium]